MTAIRIGRGRPLRFFGVVLSGWVALRVVMLWPQLDSPAAVLRAIAPVPIAAARTAPDVAQRTDLPTEMLAQPLAPRGHSPEAAPQHRAPNPTRVALALLGLVRFGDSEPDPEAPAPILPGVPRSPPPGAATPLPPRLSGSFWLVARGGSGIAPGVVGGQLGGSQAGLRLAYRLDRKRRFALAARATTPLGPGSRELAAGVEWQPTRLPLRIVAEHRFVVDGGGRGGPALGIVGGLGPKRLGAGLTLEAYGQAGLIRRDRAERYADGAVHIAHKLLDLGDAKIDIGGGAWGGAQRGAARLDVGPTLALSVPVAHKTVRLSLDWRERVAGQARPGSGLALTLGTDF